MPSEATQPAPGSTPTPRGSPSRSNCARRPAVRLFTPSSASRLPTWAGRLRQSGRVSGASRACRSRETLPPAPTLHQLSRIYIIANEPEKALDQLEPLLRIPYYLSPGWLKIDPNFAPLRGNPRFERLIAGH